jgi:putative flippase GtrA
MAGNSTLSRLTTLAQAAMRGEVTWVRYLAASAIALVADTALFMILLHEGVQPIAASVIGYVIGIAVHWLITSRAVFSGTTAARGTMARQKQKALFAISALAGLALTTVIVGGGSHLGLDPRLAKLVAIIVSFQTTYMLRRHIVFSEPTHA